MAKKRVRKTEASVGGAAYARANNLVGVLFHLTRENRELLHKAAALAGFRSLDAWLASVTVEFAKQAIDDFRKGAT